MEHPLDRWRHAAPMATTRSAATPSSRRRDSLPPAHPHEQHWSVRSGRLDDQQPPDDQRGHQDRARARADLPDRDRHPRVRRCVRLRATSSRRASALPTTSRATAGRRCSDPGGCSTTSSSSNCRAARSAATGGSSTTTRSTRSTGPTSRRQRAARRHARDAHQPGHLGSRNEPDRLPARVARLRPHRPRPEAHEAAGGDGRLRTPAERRGRPERPLRAQADRPRDRGHPDRTARRLRHRDLHHREPGRRARDRSVRRSGRGDPGARARLRQRRVRCSRSGSPRTGTSGPATSGAGCMATTQVSRSRTRTGAPARTSAGCGTTRS